jgi:hypothetical protein
MVTVLLAWAFGLVVVVVVLGLVVVGLMKLVELLVDVVVDARVARREREGVRP